ncbi:DMT family transporter [Macromonas nakdongensis]|uniref:DMT family transporter n=1 Tax=Macromonas nakdongensis TaxID=1843082 RepID=UPI000C32C41F|nr:DMT family transporter [Macromonas nakdongensis]
MSGHVYARPLQGVVFLVLAVACFATLDTSVKVLGASVSVLLVVWFRYLFQAVVMAGFVLPTRGWRSLRTRHPWLHLLRGALLLLVSTLGFISLGYMPIGEFTAIVMLTPLVVTLLAAVFLKEPANLLRWALVLGGFGGALLVIQPTGQAIGWAVALPLVMTLAYAVFQILTSRMTRTEDAMTLHFYTGWVGALLISLALPWVWQSIDDLRTAALLGLAGLMGTVGHFLLIQAFARAPAGVLAPYLYVQIGFALFAGWLVFDHVPGTLEWWGIALIAACGATMAWLSARAPQTARPARP